MTIVLHRFPLSHFAEKGRAILEFKKLDFRIEEHQLGLPQIGLRRMSGQRKVPVIDDGGRIVADSTEIALYLEDRTPDPRLLPSNPDARREVMALEDRIDHWMGSYAPVAWFDWIVRERPRDVERLLEVEVWGLGSGRLAARAVHPLMRLGRAKRLVEKSVERTHVLLGELCERLEKHPYLCGDEPTLADVAAAGLAFHLEFPKTRHSALPEWEGVGVPGFADSAKYARFFGWRRDFYAEHLG